MHFLYEVDDVIRHIRTCDGGTVTDIDDVAAIRLSLVLQVLGTLPNASTVAASTAWQMLEQTARHNLIKVFLDQDGVCRGHAILVSVDATADARIRADPEILTKTDSNIGGTHAWIREISGGNGQGQSMVRHLCNHALRQYNSISYVRSRGGETAVRTIDRNRLRRFEREQQIVALPGSLRFTHLRLTQHYLILFSHYMALQARQGLPSPSLAAACQNFSNCSALLQYYFDPDDAPQAFLSWAMLGVEALARINAERPGCLRPEQWRSGTVPYVVEALGQPERIARLVEQWAADHPDDGPLRHMGDVSSPDQMRQHAY